jgi:hypothetical protein
MVVEPGEGGEDERIVRLDLAGLHQRGLSVLESAGVLVDLRQREVIARLVRFELNHFLDDRFGFFGCVQLLRSVGSYEILERQLSHLGLWILLSRLLVVRDRLLDVRVVLRFAGPGLLVHVVVTVAEVEVHLRPVRIAGQCRFVLLGRALPVGPLVPAVSVLPVLLGLERTPGILPAAGGCNAQPDHYGNGERRCLSHSPHALLKRNAFGPRRLLENWVLK